MFQNIPECSRMFQKVPECTRMLTVSKSKPWNNNVMQLNHSGVWTILDVLEGCRKVDFQVDHTVTDWQTYIRTCWAVYSQPKTFRSWSSQVPMNAWEMSNRSFYRCIICLPERREQSLHFFELIHDFGCSHHVQEASRKHHDPPGQVSLNWNDITLLWMPYAAALYPTKE